MGNTWPHRLHCFCKSSAAASTIPLPPSVQSNRCVQKSKLRVDAFLAAKLPDISRSRIQDCIKDGLVLVNDAPQHKASSALRLGDNVVCGTPPPRVSAAEPEDIPLEIVYEDDDVIVVNKRAGMVVHPAPGNYSGTLVNAILHHCHLPAISALAGTQTPMSLEGVRAQADADGAQAADTARDSGSATNGRGARGATVSSSAAVSNSTEQSVSQRTTSSGAASEQTWATDVLQRRPTRPGVTQLLSPKELSDLAWSGASSVQGFNERTARSMEEEVELAWGGSAGSQAVMDVFLPQSDAAQADAASAVRNGAASGSPATAPSDGVASGSSAAAVGDREASDSSAAAVDTASPHTARLRMDVGPAAAERAWASGAEASTSAAELDSNDVDSNARWHSNEWFLAADVAVAAASRDITDASGFVRVFPDSPVTGEFVADSEDGGDYADYSTGDEMWGGSDWEEDEADDVAAALPARPKPITTRRGQRQRLATPFLDANDDDLLVPGQRDRRAAAAATAALMSADTEGGLVILRPGIVHRLDKGTSGLMVVCRKDKAMCDVGEQFRERTVSRVYVSITAGMPKEPSGTIRTNIGRHPIERKLMTAFTFGSGRGKEAVSTYRVIQHLADGTAALVEWRLLTGRTHQIRVHAKHLGCPLFGDDAYGGVGTALSLLSGNSKKRYQRVKHLLEDLGRPALHAKTLGFQHPSTGERLDFDSALPADLELTIQELDRLPA